MKDVLKDNLTDEAYLFQPVKRVQESLLALQRSVRPEVILFLKT